MSGSGKLNQREREIGREEHRETSIGMEIECKYLILNFRTFFNAVKIFPRSTENNI